MPKVTIKEVPDEVSGTPGDILVVRHTDCVPEVVSYMLIATDVTENGCRYTYISLDNPIQELGISSGNAKEVRELNLARIESHPMMKLLGELSPRDYEIVIETAKPELWKSWN